MSDTLPAGLSFVSGTGTNWSCGAVSQVVTCTRTIALAVGAQSAITLTVGVTGTRPVDPNWDKRSPGIWQQYELRVKRLDIQFDEKLKQLYEAAMGKGLWKGTAAAQDRVAYWAEGVVAYFNAMGQDGTPNDAAHPITTREMLKEYDPDLYALVNETMAYDGHFDWRYTPYHP